MIWTSILTHILNPIGAQLKIWRGCQNGRKWWAKLNIKVLVSLKNWKNMRINTGRQFYNQRKFQDERANDVVIIIKITSNIIKSLQPSFTPREGRRGREGGREGGCVLSSNLLSCHHLQTTSCHPASSLHYFHTILLSPSNPISFFIFFLQPSNVIKFFTLNQFFQENFSIYYFLYSNHISFLSLHFCYWKVFSTCKACIYFFDDFSFINKQISATKANILFQSRT